ncbi:hypothetical protein F4679DRAFT_530787 [Xylaria curta]|nr:hypothetical protein F4679DRAFT_530787 [Xylaria curta]
MPTWVLDYLHSIIYLQTCIYIRMYTDRREEVMMYLSYCVCMYVCMYVCTSVSGRGIAPDLTLTHFRSIVRPACQWPVNGTVDSGVG